MMRDVSINISVKFTQPRLDARGQQLPPILLDDGNLEPNINISLDVPHQDEVLARSGTPTRVLQMDGDDEQPHFPGALLRSGGNARTLQYNRHSFKSRDFKSETAPSSSKHIRSSGSGSGSGSGRDNSLAENEIKDENDSSSKDDADGYSDGSLTPIPDSPPRKKGKARVSHVKPLSDNEADQGGYLRVAGFAGTKDTVQSNSRSDGAVHRAPQSQSRSQRSKPVHIQPTELQPTGPLYQTQPPSETSGIKSKYITPSRFEEIYLQRAEEMRLAQLEHVRLQKAHVQADHLVGSHNGNGEAGPSQSKKAKLSQPQKSTLSSSSKTPINQSPLVSDEIDASATSRRSSLPPPAHTSENSTLNSKGRDDSLQPKEAPASESRSSNVANVAQTTDALARQPSPNRSASSFNRISVHSPLADSEKDPSAPQSASQLNPHPALNSTLPSAPPDKSSDYGKRSSSRLKSTGMDLQSLSSKRDSIYRERSPETESASKPKSKPKPKPKSKSKTPSGTPNSNKSSSNDSTSNDLPNKPPSDLSNNVSKPSNKGPSASFEKITLRLPGPSKNGEMNESLKILSNSNSPPGLFESRPEPPSSSVNAQNQASAGPADPNQPSTSSEPPRTDFLNRKTFMFKTQTPESYLSQTLKKRKRKSDKLALAQSKFAIDDGANKHVNDPNKPVKAFEMSEVFKEAQILHLFDPIPKPSLEENRQSFHNSKPAPSPIEENGYSLPDYNSSSIIPPRYDGRFANDFKEQIDRRLEILDIARYYPNLVPVANNPITKMDLVTYFDNISVEGLHRNAITVPIYKCFFGDGRMVEKALHKKILLTVTDSCMLLMDTATTLAKIWRVIPFYLISDLKLRDDPRDLPLITFKIDPRDEISHHMSTAEISFDPVHEWISFFVDNKHPYFHEVSLKNWAYNMRRVITLKNRPIEPYPLIDAVKLFGRWRNGELKGAIKRIHSPANRAFYTGAKYDSTTQGIDFSANRDEYKRFRNTQAAQEAEMQPDRTSRHSISTEKSDTKKEMEIEWTEPARSQPPRTHDSRNTYLNEMLNISDSESNDPTVQKALPPKHSRHNLNELQAQISLSLGTIREMTSGWQKPSRSAGSTSIAASAPKQDDLTEWMSRPSRLGLGAAPAQTSVPTVDAKLQRKLTQKTPKDGSKSTKSDGEDAKDNANDDEDEGSRYTNTSASMANKKKSSIKSYLDKPHSAKKAVVGVDPNVQLSKKQRKKLNKKLREQQQK
ncbi:hypothetical protein E3P92_03146 [Wallemia ichthyophaga]|nr:hypothetical protein E3P92_03146 [Wallemia ichthyophaga]